MDHIICINQNSFPANSHNEANELFDNALQGVLELQSKDNDRFIFYLDSNDGGLFDFELAKGFTYDDFISNHSDSDIQLFLYEIEDKSPALDHLSEDQISEMSTYNFYIPESAVDNFPDVYGLAWSLSGFLLSIATSKNWEQSNITFGCAREDGIYVNETVILRNISTQAHGKEHYKELHKVDLKESISPHLISEPLLKWFHQQTDENQSKIFTKIILACGKNFQGGEPLFKTLNGDEGLREIRFSAFAGGAIRILFKHYKDRKQILLLGFIKHSDDDGYDIAKIQACKIYQDLVFDIKPVKDDLACLA